MNLMPNKRSQIKKKCILYDSIYIKFLTNAN